MYAVIKTGGRQFRVKPGDRIEVEKLPGAPGSTVIFEEVLLISAGREAKVGAPVVPEARVKATVETHGRGPKVIVYKFRRRKGYHKKQGHRQEFTRLRIEKMWVGAEPEDVVDTEAAAESLPTEEVTSAGTDSKKEGSGE